MPHGPHDHGHGHGHGPPLTGSAGARHQRRLVYALVLAGVVFVAEAVTAMVSGSLALLSDAGHMLTDIVGVGMALAAIQLAARGAVTHHRSFGLYRVEILAALANAVLLFGVSGYVLVEAAGRFSDPPDVPGVPVLVVAVIGLAANLAAFGLLHAGAKESLNVRGAYLEVLSDALGSVGVIVAALVIIVTGWHYADPIAGVVIGLFILPRTWRLAGQAVRILVQAAPPDIDMAQVAADLAALPGVVDVHDLHVWTLTSDMEVASAHLMVAVGADTHGVLDQARHLLSDRYRVRHATLQVEPEDHVGCDELTW